MNIILQHLINALTVGSLYALVAIGYTMVYGILRLINFAHGDIFMLALYFGFLAISVFHIPWYIAFLLIIVATMLLGMLTERLAYRPLRKQNAPKISLLISAIGISFFMENLATVLFTGRPKTFPDIELFTQMLVIGGVRVQALALYVPLVTAAFLAALLIVIDKTKSGMAMRAVSKDLETARLMGVNVNKTISFTFATGSVLAAVGAIFWGMRYPQIVPLVGVMPGLKCFIAAVIGGIGNIKGAVIGGLMLGVIEVGLVAAMPELNSYKNAFAFVLLILILLFRPTGIIGEKIAEKV